MGLKFWIPRKEYLEKIGQLSKKIEDLSTTLKSLDKRISGIEKHPVISEMLTWMEHNEEP